MKPASMKAEREQLLATMQRLVQCGLNRGASGNASVRVEGGLLITPSGMDVEAMLASDMVFMNMEGANPPANGISTSTSSSNGRRLAPSSTPIPCSPPRSPACARMCRPSIT